MINKNKKNKWNCERLINKMDTTKILTDNSNEHIFDQNKQKTRKIKQEKLHYTLKTFLKVHKPKTTLKRYVILFTGSLIDILCSNLIIFFLLS